MANTSRTTRRGAPDRLDPATTSHLIRWEIGRPRKGRDANRVFYRTEPLTITSKPRSDVHADVVVVGGGQAGMTAALGASHQGPRWR
jgi:hypothetical protein